VLNPRDVAGFAEYAIFAKILCPKDNNAASDTWTSCVRCNTW
jgi:hypothetical protein